MIRVHEAETARLDAHLQDLHRLGRGGLVALAGAPWLGKTTVLHALADRARERDIEVISGRSVEADAAEPYASLPPPIGGRDIAGLRESLRRLTRTPTLLLLDDVHLADRHTVAFLADLARRPLRAPLQVVLAYRPRQTDPGLRHALAQSDIDQVALRPLRLPDSARLLGRPEPEVRTAHRAARGIPLLLLAPDPADELLRTAVAAEIAALPPPVAAALRAAAALGEESTVRQVAAVAELDRDTACAAMSELLRRDLLRRPRGEDPAHFREPELRAVVHETIQPCDRGPTHRRALEVLTADGATAARRAAHAARAPVPADVPLFVAAARESAADDPAATVRWLEAAGQMTPELPDPLLLASALVALGRTAKAAETLDDVLAAHPGSIPAVTDAALLDCFRHRAEHAVGRLDRHPARDTVPLRLRRAVVGLFAGEPPAPDNDAVPAPEPAEHAGATVLAALHAAHTGDGSTALRLVTQAAVLADRAPDAVLAETPDVLVVLGWVETMLARFGEATRHLERARRLHADRSPGCLATIVLLGLGMAQHCSGDLTAARDSAREARALAERIGAEQVARLAETLETAYLAWSEPGGGIRARAAAERAACTRQPDNWWFGANVALLLAAALEQDGEAERGAAVILTAGGGPDLALLPPMLRPRSFESLAGVAADSGDVEGARYWADLAAEAGRTGGLPHHTAYARFTAGHAARAAGSADAAPLYRAAAALFAQAHMSGARLRALAAATRVAEGTPSARTDHLVMSELARRCGATRLLTPADAHTVTVPVDLSSLTAREAEVATVAATGLRSREIADELGLSSRTVDLHLGRIYRKLGIASRTELVRLLLTRAAQLTR